MYFDKNSEKRDLSILIGKRIRDENMIPLGIITRIDGIVDGHGHESKFVVFEDEDGNEGQIDSRAIGGDSPNTRTVTISRVEKIDVPADKEYIKFRELKDEHKVNSFAYKPCWKPKKQRQSDFMDGVTEVITIGG